MNILGINFLSESTACLIKNGKLVYAISEERINRKKNWYGIPNESINIIKKITKNKIDKVVTCGYSALNKSIPEIKEYEKKIDLLKKTRLNPQTKLNQIKFLNQRKNHEDHVINVRTLKIINTLKNNYKNLKVYDHHTSHAASAAFYSKFKQCFVLTIDGWGDDASSKIFKFDKKGLELLSRTETFNSLGYFYGSITKLLGFKPHQHEGKILGLAAYGNPKKAYNELKNLIGYDNRNKKFIGYYEKGVYQAQYENNNLKYLLKKFSREDICAATQMVLEETVIKCVKSLSKKKN